MHFFTLNKCVLLDCSVVVLSNWKDCVRNIIVKCQSCKLDMTGIQGENYITLSLRVEGNRFNFGGQNM